MAAYDIAAAEPISATGMLKNLNSQTLGRVRVQKLHIPTLVAGSIVLRDGGATGPKKLEVVLIDESDSVTLDIPERGILFTNGVHVTIVGTSNVLVFYEG